MENEFVQTGEAGDVVTKNTISEKIKEQQHCFASFLEN